MTTYRFQVFNQTSQFTKNPIDQLSLFRIHNSKGKPEYPTIAKIARVALNVIAATLALSGIVAALSTGNIAFCAFSLSSIPLTIFASRIKVSDDPFESREWKKHLPRHELKVYPRQPLPRLKIDKAGSALGREVQKKIEASYSDRIVRAPTYREKNALRIERDQVALKARIEAEDLKRKRLESKFLEKVFLGVQKF